MQALLIVSHGSRSSKTIDEVQMLIGRIKAQTDISIIRYAFLEIATPSIPEGIDVCVADGARELFILLNFLNAGMHVDQDIPEIVAQAREKYPDVTIKLSTPIGQHYKIPNLFIQLLDDLRSNA